MPATKYQRILKFMKTLDKEKIYHIDELKNLIRMHIATTESLVTDTLHQMVGFNMLKEVEAFKFKVL